VTSFREINMERKVKIIIDRYGRISFIYNDDLRGLLKAGKSEIRRASHVEPVGDKWEADLSPSGGPKLGLFETRADALRAEVEWLEEHNFGMAT
jgi:hypothetical protein